MYDFIIVIEVCCCCCCCPNLIYLPFIRASRAINLVSVVRKNKIFVKKQKRQKWSKTMRMQDKGREKETVCWIADTLVRLLSAFLFAKLICIRNFSIMSDIGSRCINVYECKLNTDLHVNCQKNKPKTLNFAIMPCVCVCLTSCEYHTHTHTRA